MLCTHRRDDQPLAERTTVPSADQGGPLLCALLAIGLFLFGALAVMQNDSWWHLRCGQLIWQLGRVPHHDPFSFVLGAEAHWPNHEWLAQIVLYAIWWLGGLPLVNLGIGALVAAAGLFLVAAMEGPLPRRVLMLWLLLPCLAASFSVRPQVWTLLALALLVFLLIRERYRYIPLLFLAWANLHGGVVLGGLLLVGACLAALLLDRTRLGHLLIVTTASGLATLLTPMGIDILTFPIESVARLKQLDLVEWSAPAFTRPMHLYFWALLATFTALVVRRLRRPLDWPTGMLTINAALLTPLAMMSERNAPIFLIVAAAAASRLLVRAPSPEVTPDPAGLRLALSPAQTRWAQGAVVACAGTLTWAFAAPWERLGWDPMSPVAAAAVRACPRPTFNTYNTGGYLLWFTPEREIFIDSRQDPYPLALLQETIRAQQTGAYGALFARHGFRSAVMEPGLALGEALVRDGWRETYRDDGWVVLCAPQPHAAGVGAARGPSVIGAKKGGPPTAFAADGP